MKPIEQMTDAKINREIAERRGWTHFYIRIAYGDQLWGISPETLECLRAIGNSVTDGDYEAAPDYHTWEHAGPLLEECTKPEMGRMELRWFNTGYGMVGTKVVGDQLCTWPSHAIQVYDRATAAVTRAWLEWEREGDE